MRRKPSGSQGNDGRWFLEHIGVIARRSDDLTEEVAEPAAARTAVTSPEPAPVGAAAPAGGAMPAPPPVPTPGDTPSVGTEPKAPSGGTPASPPLRAADAERPSDTTELIGAMWQAGGEPTPLDDWEPEELSRTIRSRRNFRWTVVAVLVVLGAAAWAGLRWYPTLGERQAEVRADEYRTALADLRGALPDAQRALAAVTGVDDPSGQIAQVVDAVSPLETAADAASEIASEPLPDPPPLVSRAVVDELKPSRERVGRLAADADGIARRIGAILTYRTLNDGLLELPTLPVQASASEINDLSVALAAALADSAGIRAELPVDDALADHLATIDATLDRFSEWQVEYLDALRRTDTDAAVRLFDEITAMRVELDRTLGEGLAEVRSIVDQAIIELADEIDAASTTIPG